MKGFKRSPVPAMVEVETYHRFLGKLSIHLNTRNRPHGSEIIVEGPAR